MDKTELDADKAIDPAALDVEAVRQSELFFKWSERAIEAKHESELAEYQMDLVTARLQLDVRRNPVKYDIGEKPTEAAIKAVVSEDPKMIASTTVYFEAKKKAALLGVAAAAIEMRKRMIEELVKLYGQQYFAGPGVPRDLAAIWSSYRSKRADTAAERQTARKRAVRT